MINFALPPPFPTPWKFPFDNIYVVLVTKRRDDCYFLNQQFWLCKKIKLYDGGNIQTVNCIESYMKLFKKYNFTFIIVSSWDNNAGLLTLGACTQWLWYSVCVCVNSLHACWLKGLCNNVNKPKTSELCANL